MRLLILLPLVFATALANPAFETITRNVTGYGEDQETAIANALVEAVSQVNGVEISSTEVRESMSSESFSSTNDTSTSQFSVDVSAQQEISRATGGFVDQYEVISVEPDDAGFAANLEVNFFRYNVPGLDDNRRSIAILPFDMNAQVARAHPDASESVTRHVTDYFTQSRRFAVLDRENTAAFEAEKEIWLSADTSELEELRLGNVRVADYLIVGEVNDIQVEDNSRTLQTTGEYIEDHRTLVTVSYRIITPATRQVNWASTETIELSGAHTTANDYARAVSQAIGESALSNIYPARVVAIQGGQIVINQGGLTVEEGQSVGVFALGDPIQDPYTGEIMGQVEIPLGDAVISRVTPRVAYLEPLEGSMEGLAIGAIVRPQGSRSAEQETPARRESNAEVMDTGVKLF